MARYAKQPGLQWLLKNDTMQPRLAFKFTSISRIKGKPFKKIPVPDVSTRMIPRLPDSDSRATSSQYSRWSKVQKSEETEVLEQLTKHCHSAIDLERNHYRIKPFTEEEIDLRRKCLSCGEQKRHLQDPNGVCSFHPQKKRTRHTDGKLVRNHPCCGGIEEGCATKPYHSFTPSQLDYKYRGFISTPGTNPGTRKSKAVVLNCETVEGPFCNNEAILICAADFLTGEILLKNYVYPSTEVVQWRERIHGIRRSELMASFRKGEALLGWKAARKALWKLIDGDTILIGHHLFHDLAVLRTIHPRIVDSYILARKQINVANIAPPCTVKELCSDFLHIDIRNNEGGIRDCVEDMLATREVVLKLLRNGKAFAEWADSKRPEAKRALKILEERQSRIEMELNSKVEGEGNPK